MYSNYSTRSGDLYSHSTLPLILQTVQGMARNVSGVIGGHTHVLFENLRAMVLNVSADYQICHYNYYTLLCCLDAAYLPLLHVI